MKIRTINGASQTTCTCGSRPKHGENFSSLFFRMGYCTGVTSRRTLGRTDCVPPQRLHLDAHTRIVAHRGRTG
jgi:hypothetical protein